MMIELVQPCKHTSSPLHAQPHNHKCQGCFSERLLADNDEPSPHNDWMKGGGPHGGGPRGNGIQHIAWGAPKDVYVECIEVCLAAGWLPSIQLIGEYCKNRL